MSATTKEAEKTLPEVQGSTTGNAEKDDPNAKSKSEMTVDQLKAKEAEFDKMVKEKGYIKIADINIAPTAKLGGMTIKTEISVAVLFGLIGSFLWFMHSKGLIVWFNLDDGGFQCVLWLLFWTFMCIMGFKKESIASLGVAIMQIWNDSKTTPEQKLALIMQQVQQWLGWISDLSQLINLKNTTKK